MSVWAAYLLGFLVSFAAISCCHVVREGLRSKQVSAFRLLVQVNKAAESKLVKKIKSQFEIVKQKM